MLSHPRNPRSNSLHMNVVEEQKSVAPGGAPSPAGKATVIGDSSFDGGRIMHDQKKDVVGDEDGSRPFWPNQAKRDPAEVTMLSTETLQCDPCSTDKKSRNDKAAPAGESAEEQPKSVRNAAYYKLLKVPTNASLRTIHYAYYDEATLCHPSKSPWDSSASERFCALTLAYQTLSNKCYRERYDSQGPGGSDQSAIRESDAEDFYAVLFGSEELRSIVGDLNTVHDTDLLFKCMQLLDDSQDNVQWNGEFESSQPLRMARTALKLRYIIAPFADGRVDEQAFTVSCQKQAAKLAQQPMGSVFSNTIGYVLKMEAAAFIEEYSSFMGLDGAVARVRKGGSQLKCQFRVGLSGPQGRRSAPARQVESRAREQITEATAEHAQQVMTQIEGRLTKFLELALACNLDGITSTLRGACSKLFRDEAKKLGLETRLKQASAVRILGNELFEHGSEGKRTAVKTSEATGARAKSPPPSPVTPPPRRNRVEEESSASYARLEREEDAEYHPIPHYSAATAAPSPSCSICSQPSVVTIDNDDRTFCQECAAGLLYEYAVEAAQARLGHHRADAPSEASRTEPTEALTDLSGALTDLSGATEATSEQPHEGCSICYSDPIPKEICCTGSPPHFFCKTCFNGHAKTCFEAGGQYEKEQVNGGGTTRSVVGELPCPFFARDGCSGSSFSSSILRRFLTDEVDLAWRSAIGRIAIARNEAEQERAAAAQAATDARRSAVDHLVGSIQEALSLGGRMECPNCHVHGDKDDACMHIECMQCACNWCYCCGRHMDPPEGNYCQTCRTTSVYLESNPGYRRLASGNETAGYAALHEFHRRRMMYFLRRVKEGVPDALWTEVREVHNDILNNVPTEGRCIDWDAIGQAVIPLFGDTREGDVRWKDDMQDRIGELQKKIAEAEERALDASQRTEEHYADENPALARNYEEVESDSRSVSALDGTEETTILVNELFEQMQVTDDPEQAQRLQEMISEILGTR